MSSELPSVRKEFNQFLKKHGDKKVAQVSSELEEFVQFVIDETWEDFQGEVENVRSKLKR